MGIENRASKIVYEVVHRTPVFNTVPSALECLGAIGMVGGFFLLLKHSIDVADRQGRQEYEERETRETNRNVKRQAQALAKLTNPTYMAALALRNIEMDVSFPDSLLREVGSWDSDAGAQAITNTTGLLDEAARRMSGKDRERIERATHELKTGFEAALDEHTIRRPEPRSYVERGMIKELEKRLKELK